MTDAVMPEYLWLVVVGSFAAFAYGWGTGANDVANAFGTSVGAKTLTLKQAVIIAAIFEFTGALVLGRVSTSTIAGGIAQIAVFQREPEVYAYGMICALTMGFLWQAVASYFEMNVSATHSIIGAIIGFSLVYGGGDAVNWSTPDKASFPPVKGVVPIVVSWFFSPILTAIGSAIMFFLLRTIVLRSENSYNRTFWVLPVAVMITAWICVYFVLTKGAKKMISEEDDSWTEDKSMWVAAIVAGGLGALVAFPGIPLLRMKANKQMEQNEADAKAAELAAADAEGGKVKIETGKAEDKQAEFRDNSLKGSLTKIYRAATYGMNVDIHDVVKEDPIVAAMHAKAEVFDPKAEFAFSYLQVFSAVCVIFSHGAGEVGYMAGPLTTVWDVYKKGILASKVVAPIWCIIIGALGLVIGLATYGYKCTRAMGARMAKLSPTRGFCAELSTAMIIMIASQYGLPTSSSMCVTGGIIGVGMMEGAGGVNWRFFAKTFGMWIATLFVVGLGTAGLFAQGVFSPTIHEGATIIKYEDALILQGRSIYRDMNSTLYKYRTASLTNSHLTRLDNATWTKLAADIKKQDDLGKKLLTPKTVGTIKPDEAITYMQKALALLQQNTIVTLGQQNIFAGAKACNNASYDPSLLATSQVSCSAPVMFGRFNAPANQTKFP